MAVTPCSRWVLTLGVLLAMASFSPAAGGAPEPVHPRLYFSREDLPRLRRLHARGVHARIWRNIARSAEWCLARKPRAAWIAPVTPDPVYENLYDRFYAIMADLAITEHLAFAYALSGDPRYGEGVRQWVLASCRAWKPEADGAPDGAKAYAVCRLLKGIAVGYDVGYDRFTEAERREVREALVGIAGKYFAGYFSTPTIAGPEFHTHHAIVEWSSLGVTALALLGEAAEAQAWLDATVRKFEEHLLPMGLAPDGAQVEGATFWASTMHYRLFFMDPLRRLTGKDLFRPFERYLNADLALASVAARREADTYSRDHENVVLEPSYGQIDYYAPVLLCLAREFRRPTYQMLALWDQSLGSIQRTRFVTPHGEDLLFSLGGYAYLWCDPAVPAAPDEKRLAYHFPSVDEAYLRASWRPGDLLVGIRKGEMVVHAGGVPVLIGMTGWSEPVGMQIREVQDEGHAARVLCSGSGGAEVQVELDRRQRILRIRRRANNQWQWTCQGSPVRRGNRVTWGRRVTLRVVEGTLSAWKPGGYAPVLATGFGKLKLVDPTPEKGPLATFHPSKDGEVGLEIQLRR